MSESHQPDPHRAEARGVDTDRMDGGRGLWRPAAVAIVAGLIVGGALGAGYGAAQSPTYEATSALSVLPDSVVDTGNANSAAPTLDATAFIQGELVTLNGDQVKNKVQSELGLASAPDVSSTQVGQTYVVEITSTASTRQQALSVASTTAAVYKNLRTSALTQSITASVRSTNARLSTVQKNLEQSLAGQKANANVTPAQTALQTEYERLLALSSSLTLALPQVGQVVTVQSTARIVPASLSSSVTSLAIGALLGALVAVVALLIYRRVSPRIRTVGEVVDLGVPVLLPVLPRSGRRRGPAATAWRSSPARLLAARLTSGTDHQVLVVVGATSRVGTSHTAAGLAAAAAARGPVLLVLAAETGATPAPDSRRHGRDDSDGTRDIVPSAVPDVWLLSGAGDLAGDGGYAASSEALLDVVRRASAAGWFVVVDAPALSESDLALDCLADAGSVAALVVGRGVSRPADVLSAVELFESRSTGFAGAVVNDVPRGVGRLGAPRVDLRRAEASPRAAHAERTGPTLDSSEQPGGAGGTNPVAVTSASRPKPTPDNDVTQQFARLTDPATVPPGRS